MAAKRRGSRRRFEVSSKSVVLGVITVVACHAYGVWRHGTPTSFVPPASAAHEELTSRRSAAAVGLFIGSVPILPAHAEETDGSNYDPLGLFSTILSRGVREGDNSTKEIDRTLKVVRSKTGIQMELPTRWSSDTDRGTDRLIYGFTFGRGAGYQGFGYTSLRVEQIQMAPLLIGEQFIPSDADRRANAWSTTIQDPITTKLMAAWIMRKKERTSLKVKGISGEVLDPRDPTDQNASDASRKISIDQVIVDATLPDGGKDRGEDGSELLWHQLTQVKNDAGTGDRVQSCKAVLRNGIITVAYLSAPKTTFDREGPFLESIVNSLKVTAPRRLSKAQQAAREGANQAEAERQAAAEALAELVETKKQDLQKAYQAEAERKAAAEAKPQEVTQQK